MFTHWATVSKKTGKIVSLQEGITAELDEFQFPLTSQEYYMLRATRGVDGDLLEQVEKILNAVRAKYEETKMRLKND